VVHAARFADGVALPCGWLDRPVADVARGLGLELFAYLADRREDLTACMELELDGVITDRLVLALGARRRYSRGVHLSVGAAPSPVASLRPSIA
jgi:glycerophosphoryl diester phosphodiesterase